jgi:hypothetical protein
LPNRKDLIVISGMAGILTNGKPAATALLGGKNRGEYKKR